MLKYIIWDFDGVICDSKKIAFDAHNNLCKKYTKLPTISNEYDYSAIMDKGYDEALSKYLTNIQIDEYWLDHREAIFERRYELKVFRKIVDNIKQINVPSIIVTATYEKLVRDVLNNNGYKDNMFEVIIGRETQGSKSSKIVNFCNKFNIKKDEVVYIGDTLSDIDFCQKLEIPIISVGYGYCPSELLKAKNSLKLCSTEEELIQYIKNELDSLKELNKNK